MPVEWMLPVLRDPEAEQSRRDQMAALAAPYLHPRLNAVATSHVNGGNGGGGDVGIINIFAVPRGARIESDGTAITIDGTPVELETIKPFEPTPPLELTDQRDQTVRFGSIAEPLPVHEAEQPANVTRLDRYRDRDDDPAGAA